MYKRIILILIIIGYAWGCTSIATENGEGKNGSADISFVRDGFVGVDTESEVCKDCLLYTS
ncbi:MAG: hypothetical protein N2746_02410, partial [Deltaproteobacteria bacterium]|nr:hypothetical protein [Deltaproteobacteria bacterium]